MYHSGLAHLIVTTIVKGLIYGVIWKFMRELTLPEAVMLAGLVIVMIAAGQWLAARRS